MLTKSVYASCLTVCGYLFLLTGSGHADVPVLKEIAEAERSISYIGVRLKIFGSRTLEEVVTVRFYPLLVERVHFLQSMTVKEIKIPMIGAGIDGEETESLGGNVSQVNSLRKR